ncbi:MAG: class I SAM-dependent methyltransferase [Desulfobacterales bacterium]|nr:class I SAM-dependent methyltransferase [Desulfobacterales bacterium]
MTISVDPDWWQTLFDEVYLITDARTVGNAEITRYETDIYSRLLSLHPDARLLDLCGGQGRHTLEFCRRGFKRCTLVDYSRPLLEIGRETARREGLSANFIQADARCLPLNANSSDYGLILGNSLGYMGDQVNDRQLLAECRRVIAPGGRLLLDVADGEMIRTRIAPNAWHEIDGDVVVCREREVRDECVCARELVLSKERGLIRDMNYRIRLYDRETLLRLVRQAGFVGARVHDQGAAASATGSDADVGCMRHRLLVTAHRP